MSNSGKRSIKKVFIFGGTLLALAACVIISLSELHSKVNLNDIAGRIIRKEAASDSEEDSVVYENDFFNFGMRLSGKEEVLDRDGAYEYAKESGWISNVELVDRGLYYYELLVENLRKGDGKYIEVSYYRYKPQLGKNEKEICDKQIESRRKNLEIDGYKIFVLETVEIPFAGKNHYALKESYFKSGQHSYVYKIYYKKQNALCYICFTSYESEEELNNLVASCYELEAE